MNRDNRSLDHGGDLFPAALAENADAVGSRADHRVGQPPGDVGPQRGVRRRGQSLVQARDVAAQIVPKVDTRSNSGCAVAGRDVEVQNASASERDTNRLLIAPAGDVQRLDDGRRQPGVEPHDGVLSGPESAQRGPTAATGTDWLTTKI